MNILIISPERYQDFYTSKIHIANHLKKKHKVFFLNPYVSIKQNRILDEKLLGIHIINIISINFFSKFIDVKKHYIKMINNRISKIDMIWCFDTTRANLLEDLDSKTKLFHRASFVLFPIVWMSNATAEQTIIQQEKISYEK